MSDRVRAALTDATTSDDLKALIESAGFELEATRQKLQAAKARAVDPISTDADAASARREHHDLGFEEERQANSVARLKHRLAEVLDEEAEGRRREAYEAVAADHGELADRLRDRYPALAQEIADMLGEVVRMNERVKAVNLDLPAGAKHYQPVEHVARGPVEGVRMYSTELTYPRPESLVRAVRLPRFNSQDALTKESYLWLGLEKPE